MPSPSGTSSFSRRARSYSRPQTPTSTHTHTRASIYNPSPSRGKPKVLPFPDSAVASVSRSRDASRTTSPSETPPLLLSPRGSQSGGSSSTLGLASLGGLDASAPAAAGYFGSREDDQENHNTSSAGPSSAAGSGANTPTGSASGGTTTPRSPLGRPSFSLGNQPFHAHATRSRSLTTPDDMSRSRNTPTPSTSANAAAGPSRPQPSRTSTPTPPSILLNPIVSSANPTTRIEGFNPVPLSPTTTIRPSSVPITGMAQPSVASAASASASLSAAAVATTLPPTPVPKDSPLISPPSPSMLKQPMGPLTVPITSAKLDHGLGDHLRQSFMKGTCADVRIWVRKWGVGWPVHRMVLVQAGFFHSLFMMGFSETGARASRKGKERLIWEDDTNWSGEDIELQFDDPNITRTAFEICLSRLYSGYPELRFPSALIPTPQHPLTPVFAQHTAMPDYPAAAQSLPAGTYLATPRLLLSLLATTIYLGQTGLMKEVLHTILRTIGPATICRYLNFAIGDGIGEEEWDGQTAEASKEVEGVARKFTLRPAPAEDDRGSRRIRSNRSSTDSTGSNMKVVEDDDEVIMRDGNRRTSRPSPLSLGSSSHNDDEDVHDHEDDHEGMPHFYGFAADKIGEACCCYLSRWAVDILNQEAKHPNTDTTWRVFGAGGIHAKFLRTLLSSDSLFVKDEMERYRMARKVLDLRRRHWDEEEGGSASGDLGVALASSDSSADGQEWEGEEDEVELEKVFTDGIYYTHMTFDDLSTIASDIDPHSSLPFAPLNVLQAAHWSAADLKARILAAGAAALPEADLGLAKSVTEISPSTRRHRRNRSSRNVNPSLQQSLSTSFFADSTVGSGSISSAMSSTPSSQSIMYHPVPSDDTHRIGAAGLLFTDCTSRSVGIPGMPDLGPALADSTHDPLDPPTHGSGSGSGVKARPHPHTEKTYFGLSRACRLLPDLLSSSSAALSSSTAFSAPNSAASSGTGAPASASPTKWSKLDPFRFSVEFWDAHLLPERERIYSTTHFYAGSWYNVYVQTIRKKEKSVQLGVYLHRQAPGESFPTPSAPGRVASASASATTAAGGEGLGLGMTGGAPLGRSTTGHVTVGSPRSTTTTTTEAEGVKRDDEAYRDTRPVNRAYFSISCASALGSALIRFSSAPDNFTLSQSWGWKSSALRSAEYLLGAQDPAAAAAASASAVGGGASVVSGGVGGVGSGMVSGDNLEQGVLGWVGETKDLPKGGSLRASVVVGLV